MTQKEDEALIAYFRAQIDILKRGIQERREQGITDSPVFLVYAKEIKDLEDRAAAVERRIAKRKTRLHT